MLYQIKKLKFRQFIDLRPGKKKAPRAEIIKIRNGFKRDLGWPSFGSFPVPCTNPNRPSAATASFTMAFHDSAIKGRYSPLSSNPFLTPHAIP